MRPLARYVAAVTSGVLALTVGGGMSSSVVANGASTLGPLIALNGHFGNDIKVFLAAVDGSTHDALFMDIPVHVVQRPDWSPDGQQLAVEALGDGDMPTASIWVTDATGAGAREVAACEALPCLQLGMPAWSPDGSSLALVRYDIASDGQTWGASAIEILDLASGARRIIAETADAHVSFAYPRWSPDGRSIVAETQEYSGGGAEDELTGSAIAIWDAAAGPTQLPRPVTQPDGFGAHPDWSPDGTRIVFGTYGIESFETGGPGASDLYTVHPDGSGLVQLTAFAAGETRAGHPSWTPDGTRIIFTKIDGTDFGGMGSRRAAFIDADGANLTIVSEEHLGTYPRLQPTP